MAKNSDKLFSIPFEKEPPQESITINTKTYEIKDVGKYLISETRIYRSADSIDSITISMDLARKPERLLECLKILLNEKGFVIESYSKKNSCRFPEWFCSEEHSIEEWLAMYFEHSLIERYKELYMKGEDYVRDFFEASRKSFKECRDMVDNLKSILDKELIEFIYFIPLDQCNEKVISETNKGLAILKESEDYESLKSSLNEFVKNISENATTKLSFIDERKEEKTRILERILYESGLELSEVNSKEETKLIIKKVPSLNDIFDNIDESKNEVLPRTRARSNIEHNVSKFSEQDHTESYQKNEVSIMPTIKFKEREYTNNFPIQEFQLKCLQELQFLSDLEQEIYEKINSISAHSEILLENGKHIKTKLESILKEVFPNTNVYCVMYGSLATGLALESSDVDIAVCDLFISSKIELIHYMQELNVVLKEKSFVKSSQLIETARVPVIKLVLYNK